MLLRLLCYSFLIILSLSLTYCSSEKYPSYSKTSSGIFYKLHYLGDGVRKPEKGDYIRLCLTQTTWNDSIIYSQENYQFRISNSLDGGFQEAISLLMEGDSASFILPASIDGMIKKPAKVEKKDSIVKMNVRLYSVKSPEEFAEEQKYLAWKNDQEMNEQIRLKKYFHESNIENKKLISGIYYIETDPGRGKPLKNGDIVYLHYRGYFLDGSLFDNTYVMKEPFDFTLGSPGQVLKGFETGLRQMKKGGKGKIIIPSQLAFGEKGSTDGTVPPFTTVIYEVELVQVRYK